MSDLGHCRSCGAEIMWTINEKSGRRSPVNLDGVSHFATCPDAAKWRKRRKGLKGSQDTTS